MRDKGIAVALRDLERLVLLANVDTRLRERAAAIAELTEQLESCALGGASPRGPGLVAELRLEVQALEARREEAMRDLPPTVLELYADLLGDGRHPPVVSVAENTCLGCNARLPSGLLDAIRARTALHQCPRCARLLYHPRRLRAPEPAPT